MKPYFLPVYKGVYLNFTNGQQLCEVRPLNHRGWNEKNIYPGRELAITNGYQPKYGQLIKPIIRTAVATNLEAAGVPGWHVDIVNDIYGARPLWLVAWVEL